ncbi:MAG: response regulator, partial [Limnothrix sp. RL_2_0]|nr:response regulator [Limnothrix sp. RL_2_0]
MENPADLINQVIVQQPSLIILDAELIGDKVYEICQKLRENIRTKNIPLLLVNVANESVEKVRGLQAGVQDIITKPFIPLELHKLLEKQILKADLKQQWQTQNNYLKRTIGRQKLLRHIICRIRNNLDLDYIFQSTAKEIYQAFSCSRVVIYRFNEDWSGNFVAEAFSPQWRSLVDVCEEVDENFAKNSASNQENCVVKLFTENDAEPLKDTYLQENKGGIYAKGISYRAVDDVSKASLTPCYLKLLESFEAKAYIIIPIF